MRRNLAALLLLWPLAAAAQGTPQGTTVGGGAGPTGGGGPAVVYPGAAPIIATPLPPLAGTPPGAAAPSAPAASAPAAPPPPSAAPSLAAPPSGASPQAGSAAGGAPGSAPGAPAAAVPGPAGAAPPAAGAPADTGSPLPATWLPRGIAVLRVLNKQTALTHTLTVVVGASARIGPLTITVQACVVRPPDMPGDAAAFLAIADGTPGVTAYQGWILKNEPFLSMFQNPLYDVQVTGCRT